MTHQKRVTVRITCNHPAPSDSSRRKPYAGPPETILVFEFDPEISEPRGILTGPLRIVVDGEVQQTSGPVHMRDLMRLVAEARGKKVVSVDHELRCPCGISPRVPDRRLQEVMRVAGGMGVFELELINFEQYRSS